MSIEAVVEPAYPAEVIDALFASIATGLAMRHTPLLVGISGLQGSGKSTLTEQLRVRAIASGHATVAMSLDDFYWTRAERQLLANDVHPLLATRGVPGTHDLALLRSTLDALPGANVESPVAIPIFDKGSDDRALPSRWPRLTSAPALILLEGWCVGVPAQVDDDLCEPVNALERDEDSDGRWRDHVNTHLRRDYQPLWESLDRLIVLLAPSFDVVVQWRDQQEQALRARHAEQAMSSAAVERFVAHYERLSRHAIATLPARADIVVRLDEQRQVVALEQAAQAMAAPSMATADDATPANVSVKTMPILVDSHSHLDAPEFDTDRNDVIARARAAGVTRQVIPAIALDGFDALCDLCANVDGLHPAYGLHPMFLDRHQPAHLDQLADWLQRERPVAVGECGLDFYVAGLDADVQRLYFQRQLELARDFDLPVIIHARRAVDEVIASLRRVGGLRGVIHSYSGSVEQARQLWKLGFHLGIGGPVTYERANRLRSLVSTMPIEHLLLETDAPDQPLASHRGARNEPAWLPEVLVVIAQLRGESEQSVAAATTRNARALFGLPTD